MSATEARITIPYIYHTDLSDALPGFDYVLHAYLDESPLFPHTPETRAAARAANPRLASVPDEQLTHFSAPVQIPFDAACHVHISGLPADRANEGYVHFAGITVPPSVPPEGPLSEMLDYPSTAADLLFHHPDLLSADRGIATLVMQHMSPDDAPANYEEILKLALSMRRQGPPSEIEGKGWAQLVPTVTAKGGKFFLVQPSPLTIKDAAPAMARVELTTKNDLRLQGLKWSQEQGFSVVTDTQPEEPSLVAVIQNAGADSVQADVTTTLYGIRTFVEPSATSGSGVRARVRIENYFFRYLAVYIRFLNADGITLDTPTWFPDGVTEAPDYSLPLANLRFLDLLGPTASIFGAPDPTLPGSLTHDITFPEDAVAARIYALGFGNGRVLFDDQTLFPALVTALGNLVVPTLLLPFGIAIKKYGDLDQIFKDQVAAAVILIGVTYAAYIAGGSAFDGRPDWRGISTIGQEIFKGGFEPLATFLAEEIKNGLLTRALPFVGWAMMAIGILSAIAQISQTIVAIATSPWAIQNRLAVTIETTVEINPDPVLKVFPPASDGPRAFNVRLIYESDQPTTSVTTPVPPTFEGDKLTAKLTNHLGGRVKFQCQFFVGTDVVASASTAWLENDLKTRNIPLFLFQKRVELTDKSEYQHVSLLTFQQGAYKWMPTKERPKSTRLSLSTDPTDGNAISGVTGLSLSQRQRQLGYAWRAAGLGIVDCTAGTPETQLNALQSVNIPGIPMKDARFSGCGYSGLSDIAYDPYPPRFKMKKGSNEYEIENGRPVPDPDDRDLGLYYVDPTFSSRSGDKGGGYHLRQIPSSGNAPINHPGPPAPSFGRFPLAVDSLVIHPSGRVLAINTQFSTLMATTLETDGRNDDELPFARRVAGPAISYTPPGGKPTLRRRPGLLTNPIAITSTYDGTVLVLEDIRDEPAVSRLQAFDAFGNPVNAFPDDSGELGPFLELPAGRRYLDLTAAGNADLTDIFILYYVNAGELPAEYHLAIYQTGPKARAKRGEPLVTTAGVSAARLAVDLFRTLYTLNWSMTTDGKGNLAGPRNPTTGPAGRTVPSLSQWLPKTSA